MIETLKKKEKLAFVFLSPLKYTLIIITLVARHNTGDSIANRT